MNRLATSIDRVQARIDETLDEDAADKLEGEMAIDFEQHFKFQELQAAAHASGKITTDEAQIVYKALGEVMSSENGGWQPGVKLAKKVSITMFMMELLQWKATLVSNAR